MPSGFVKVILALTGLSPALLLLYIVKIFHDFHKLTIYISIVSFGQVLKGLGNFIQNQYLLISFVLLVLFARYIVSFAKRNFAIGRIDVKSIKPGDPNFISIIFSVTPALVKLYSPETSDGILAVMFVIVGIIFGLTLKSSYHFNLTMKLILGYSHYEVQTKEEITYLIVSKKQLINRKEITKYVKLADHMLLNVSDNP